MGAKSQDSFRNVSHAGACLEFETGVFVRFTAHGCTVRRASAGSYVVTFPQRFKKLLGAVVTNGGEATAVEDSELASSGEVTVTITEPALGATKKVFLEFTVPTANFNATVPYVGFAAPTVTAAASPSSGSTSGGTNITVTGTGFRAGATVLVNGVAATSVVVVSPTSITCTTPAGTAGARPITVRNEDRKEGTRAASFTYT
jgi:hypothetical protein